MNYNKTYSSGTDEFLVKQMKKAGMEIPDVIQNRPTVEQGNEIFFQAFIDLSSTRNFSMVGALPISWLSIEQYAIYKSFDETFKFALHYIIPKLDAEYLKK